MKHPALILLVIFLGGCYRPESRLLVLDLPDTVGRPAELAALKNHLLAEQERLKSDLVFYHDIRIDAAAGQLHILYNREYLADMNVLGKLNRLGYRVNGLPGDPLRLQQTRVTLSLP